MISKLRNMTGIYLLKGDRVLLLFRQGGRVVNNVWTPSAGGHFEDYELNDAKACILREMDEELGIGEEDLQDFSMRYIGLRNTKGEIRQNYYFFANLKDHINEDMVSNEGKMKWFSIGELMNLEMPYTAKCVMNHYCSVGRFTDKSYVCVTNEKGSEFIELPEC